MNRQVLHSFKLLCVATLILCYSSCGSTKSFTIQDTTSLDYNLVVGQESLNLNIKVLKNLQAKAFQYFLGNTDLSGQIEMTPEACASATELFHTFNGQSKKLSKATSIWLSDSAYNSLRQGRKTTISYRTGFVKNSLIFNVKERQVIEYVVNNKRTKLSVLYCEDASEKNYKLWVWDNQSDPLILRASMGWEMALNRITTEF